MNKYLLLFLFLLGAMAVAGQKRPVTTTPKKPVAGAIKKSLVHLISSERLENIKGANGEDILKVYRGVFQQDFSTLTSDSGYFYEDKNLLDAFGHVHINQGDTLNIYSDKLHYDGNTKLATLTDHVIMIDKDATLTTNLLNYNTATRIGIYTNGGKLVNKDNTLTSLNGYYFASTRDSYFRYNVVCKTTDAIIKTDTMRYNTKDRITYFYGPTHIYGTKDKDTLYTENGDYATITELARFGKKNLYTQGTKSLKGDSLYYDRLKGYGRAVKNIAFNDNEQKITQYGDLGEYFKADDRVLVTQNAFMVIVTEEKDTTKTDSVGKRALTLKKMDSLSKTDSATIKRLGLKPVAKTKTDSATTKRLSLIPIAKPAPVVKKPTVVKTTPPAKVVPPPTAHIGAPVAAGKTAAVPLKPAAVTPGKTTASTKPKAKPVVKPKPKEDTLSNIKPILLIAKAPEHIKRDSIFLGADTLETRILTYKDYKLLLKQRWEASHIDTSIHFKHTPLITLATLPRVLPLVEPKMLVDTGLYHPYFFGNPKPKPIAPKKKLKPEEIKKLQLDSARKVAIADSLQKVFDHGLTDTSRIRIVDAHHHAKLFKSDLQAKADSMHYSYSDSTIRMYVKPMIWTQGAQLSGDTVNLQMKNKKLDNMDLFPSAFIAEVEKNDSLHFDQVGGKTMHGTFADNKLSSMQVMGNAETIYFKRDTMTNKITQMTRTLSSTAYAYFKDGQVKMGNLTTKSETTTNDIAKVKEDDKTLKNFIWKPKDRPKSKKDVLVPYIPPVDKKAAAKKVNGPVKGTMPVKDKNGNVIKTATDNSTILKTVKDSVAKVKTDTLKRPDTVKKAPAVKPKFGPPVIYN